MEFQDFDWGDFVEKLFAMPPQEPFTFDIFPLQSENQVERVSIDELMLHAVKRGSLKLFNKTFVELNAQEILKMKQYLHSLGQDAHFKIEDNHLNLWFSSLNKSYYGNISQLKDQNI